MVELTSTDERSRDNLYLRQDLLNKPSEALGYLLEGNDVNNNNNIIINYYCN